MIVKVEHIETLEDYWTAEILKGKKYSLRRVLTRSFQSKRCSFMFWLRLAYVWHRSNSGLKQVLSKYLNIRLCKKYGADINLNAEIGKGLKMGHPIGIVITGYCKIGENCEIRQNTTIRQTTITFPHRRQLEFLT